MAGVINAQNNPFLAGVHAPVADELDVRDLPVTGEIPKALHGSFLRNGPNQAFEPLGRYHVFDGDGMLHAIELEEGKAAYRNRWVNSLGLQVERRVGHAVYGGMANMVFPDPEVIGEAGPFKNTANTNIIRHAGKLMALWEAGPPTVVTTDLQTLGTHDFDGKLSGPMTAHPKIDPETGELLFFGYHLFPPYLKYHVVDSSGRLVRSVDLDIPAPVMMHDFVVTSEHVVFFDAPAIMDLEAPQKGKPILSWEPERGTRIGIMPRSGGNDDVFWVETDPCYVFHFLNAWTEAHMVYVDACRLPSIDLGVESESGAAPPAESFLSRFTVDLDTRTAKWERTAERSGDFPRVADSVAGLRNRYGYVATMSSGGAHEGQFDSITKHDLDRGTQEMYHFGAGKMTSEASFAADPDGSAEDDGWLISFVYDLATETSETVILDARDISTGPVARVPMPRRIPFGFHGNWFPA